MSNLLILNNLVSFSLVLVLWWLVHQNSSGTEPFKRVIASGYSATAMAVLTSVLARGVQGFTWLLPYVDLGVRTLLVVTLGAVAVRLALLRQLNK